MSAWLYEFTIDNHQTLTKPVIPQRMSRELHDLWNKKEARKHSKKGAKKGAKKSVDRHVLRLHRGTEHKEYPVRLSYDLLGPLKAETSLGKGWREFVTSNKLRYFDRIRLTLEDSDDMYYRVRIWRGDTEITVSDPHIFIENDGTISDVDETEYVPMECLFVPPSFIFTFSKGYHDKPVINVPVKFAREHFEGLADPTDLQITRESFVRNFSTIYEATKPSVITLLETRHLAENVSEMIRRLPWQFRFFTSKIRSFSGGVAVLWKGEAIQINEHPTFTSSDVINVVVQGKPPSSKKGSLGITKPSFKCCGKRGN